MSHAAMTIEIDNCRPGDYAAVVSIYNHYVETSHATFDIAPFSVGERAQWFNQFSDEGPHRLLVARSGGTVVGYACSTLFKTRPAYNQSVETTVYVAQTAIGRGVGKILYAELLPMLSESGMHRAYAGISLPNDASVRLHDEFGFQQVGIWHEVGYKFDRYWDVATFEKHL